MKLYEIKQIIEESLIFDEETGQLVNQDTGEVMTKEQFAELTDSLQEGIENLCCWIKNLRAESKALKEEADNLTARKKACDSKVESLSNYVNYLLAGENFSTAKAKVTYKTSPPHCEIAEGAVIPREFIKVTETPMRAELLKYIKAGNTVEGVTAVSDVSMSIK